MNDKFVRSIKNNLENVKEKLIRTAINSGRNPDNVRLIVVTKSQPLEIVIAAIKAGATMLGENYAEEGVDKIIALENESKVEWHMIGHVQSRKAELVANNFYLLHSLDSLKLAKRINRALDESGKELPVLLEFNVSGEESKYGWQASDEKTWSQLLPELKQIVDLDHLRVRGLMTMPPYYEDPELSRPFYSKLKRLRDYLADKFPGTTWNELSMGTSIDFETAIEEGSTFIRVGQAILGKRFTKRG
ncbi:MAG: YggS family pyridoxal phosphate-dependent enzyme [Chloroflexota bacterium]